MPVEIPPTAPNLFVHQAIDEMKVDCLQGFEELKGDVVEARTIIRRKRVNILQTDPPNPAQLGIFTELFGNIAQRAGGSILGCKLGYPRAAMDLDGQVPERGDNAEGTDQLRRSIDRFPAHEH